MNFIIKTYLWLFLGMLIPVIGVAQRDVFNWQLSPYAGIMTLDEEITLPKNLDSYAYGLRINRRIGDAFTVGLNFTVMNLNRKTENDIAGSFLSVGYHWDNGYLLSKRSVVSIFHRIEVGYTDSIQPIEELMPTDGELSFGFENGLKFRLGDRFSVYLAFEILSSKDAIMQGNLITNPQYSIWKIGLNYHFGSRESNFKAPVFVPSSRILPTITHLNKIEADFEDSLWIVDVDVFKVEPPEILNGSDLRDTQVVRNQSGGITRADSLLIFMHFDSLYTRRVPLDSIRAKVDSSYKSMVQGYPDSVATHSDSLAIGQMTFRDTTNSISKQKVDTVYIMQSDTSRRLGQTPHDETAGKVDTIIVVRKTKEYYENAATANKNLNENNESNNNAEQAKLANQNEISKRQVAQISRNETAINELQKNVSEKDRKNRNRAKMLGVGAAGVAVGALASSGKNHEPDTVYSINLDLQTRIDSLKREIIALKQEKKLSQSTRAVNGGYIPNPPIGDYFAADTLSADSLATEQNYRDSTYADTASFDLMAVDTTGINRDTSLLPQAKVDSTSRTTSNSLNSAPPESMVLDSTSTVPTSRGAAKSNQQQINAARVNPADAHLSLSVEYPMTCYFELNSTSLQPSDTLRLNKVMKDLKNDSTIRLLLIGHTDKSGDAAYNLRLSKLRALRVKNYFIDRGIDEKRISTSNMGAENAIKKYNKEARRVDIYILQ